MKVLGVLLGLFGILSGTGALSFAFLFWINSPIGLPCQESRYDGTLNIERAFGEGSVTFLNGGTSLLLAGGAGHHQGDLPLSVFDGLLSGSPVQLGYCGGEIVRVESTDREIFGLTQKRAEDNRLTGMRLGVRIAMVAFLAAILGRWLAQRASDS